MKENSITAVVVTYNRINCLKRVIDCLRKQSLPINDILVINNDSTDGTREWLNEQTDLKVIHQENVGGSGGFYRGIQEAMKLDNNWVWCMDDDVYPRVDCLKTLLLQDKQDVGILCPRRIQNGEDFISEVKKLNLSNPLRPLHSKVVKSNEIKSGNPIEIMGMTFEGPLIKKKVIKEIGLPNKELFILYDDTDYSYRAYIAGYKIMYIPTAIIDKELFNPNYTRVQLIRLSKWKLWYHIRNTAYFCHHYGNNVVFREFGEVILPIHMISAILFNLIRNNKYEIRDLFKVVKMFRRGHKEILGKM